MSTPEHSWAHMSAHEHLWVLRSSQYFVVMMPWALLSAHDDSRHHGVMLATSHDNWRLPKRRVLCLLVDPMLYELWRHTHECSWPFMSTHGHSLAALSTHAYSWAFNSSLSTHEPGPMTPRALMSIIGHGTMLLWALMSTHGTMTQYS